MVYSSYYSKEIPFYISCDKPHPQTSILYLRTRFYRQIMTEFPVYFRYICFIRKFLFLTKLKKEYQSKYEKRRGINYFDYMEVENFLLSLIYATFQITRHDEEEEVEKKGIVMVQIPYKFLCINKNCLTIGTEHSVNEKRRYLKEFEPEINGNLTKSNSRNYLRSVIGLHVPRRDLEYSN
uniref:Uncharacterized protein n=1 Tax=Rhizophagus irregularis (strain DAOM 181602 / DAOM 197198 / MUCL 43194) TaxID=747089 RepID=U9UVN2_RHIID